MPDPQDQPDAEPGAAAQSPEPGPAPAAPPPPAKKAPGDAAKPAKKAPVKATKKTPAKKAAKKAPAKKAAKAPQAELSAPKPVPAIAPPADTNGSRQPGVGAKEAAAHAKSTVDTASNPVGPSAPATGGPSPVAVLVASTLGLLALLVLRQLLRRAAGR